MYTVDLYLRVRLACHVDGLSQREAASRFGIARETVRKMLRHSEPPGYRRRQPPKRLKLAVPPINSDRHRNPGVFGALATGFAGAPKDVQLMTRRDDLELSHGATAKVQENAVKQDRVRVTNAIGHHPERSGAETLVFWVSQPLPWLVAPKSVPLMTRRSDLKLSHGATAKARENAVKQDRVPTTNAIKSP